MQHYMMDFFGNLRQLAGQIEHEVAEIQELAEGSRNQRATDEDEEEYADTRQLLRNLQKEVKQLKTQVHGTVKSLGDEDQFLHTVELASTVLKHQASSVKQVEEYLQQYGYQPLVVNEEATEKPPVLETQECGMAVGNDVLNTAAESTPEETFSAHVPATPQTSSKPTPAKKNRTPKLEDYGLSFDRLKTYGTLLAKSKVAEPSKPATLTYDGYPVVQTPLNCATGSQNVTPDSFKHNGLFVTPGLKLISESQASPELKHSYHPAVDSLTSSPIPPVMMTPTVPQANAAAPVAPVLATPGLMHKLNMVANDSTNPLHPVSLSPAFSALIGVSSPAPQKPELSSQVTNQNPSTPKPPESTLDITQMALLTNLMAKRSGILAYGNQDVPPPQNEKEKDEDSSTIEHSQHAAPVLPSTISDKSYVTSLHPALLKNNVEVTPPTRPTLSSQQLMATPQMPELTSKLPSLSLHEFPDKENVSPPSNSKNMPSSEPVQYNKLAHVTYAEYSDQPDYLCRFLSLEECNQAVVHFNKVLGQRLLEGGKELISEKEVNDKLSRNGKAFILLMQRLQRITSSHIHDEIRYYRPV